MSRATKCEYARLSVADVYDVAADIGELKFIPQEMQREECALNACLPALVNRLFLQVFLPLLFLALGCQIKQEKCCACVRACVKEMPFSARPSKLSPGALRLSGGRKKRRNKRLHLLMLLASSESSRKPCSISFNHDSAKGPFNPG